MGDLLSIMTEAIKYLNTYKTTLESLQPQVKDLMGQELGLLIIFNKTREDTKLFVEQNNFAAMKTLYGEADSALKSFAGVGTSGQRSDSSDFVASVTGYLSKHVSEGETIFNTFVSKHNLKFFGPLGPDIKEALAETQVWVAEADKLVGNDLESLLSGWRDETKNSFFGVNLSVDGITDAEREFITSQLGRDLETLRKAIDDNAVTFSNNNLLLIYDRRNVVQALE